VLPVGLLNRVLLKKVVIAVLAAAAEVVILSAGKRKRWSRGASPVPGRAPLFIQSRPLMMGHTDREDRGAQERESR
jgi:hypothetical protein